MLLFTITALKILSAAATVGLAYHLWRQHRAGVEANHFPVFAAAVTTAVLSISLEVLTHLNESGESRESMNRFVATTDRLSTLTNRSKSLADSLTRVIQASDSLLNQERTQLLYQQLALHALSASLDTQRLQLDQQRMLNRAQEDMFLSSLRERYPLEEPFSLWGTLEYAFVDTVTSKWIDQLRSFARDRIRSPSWKDSVSHDFADLPANTFVLSLPDGVGALFVTQEGRGPVHLDSMTFWMLPLDSTRLASPWDLRTVIVRGTLRSPTWRSPGYELRMSGRAAADGSLVSHPANRLPPGYGLITTVILATGQIRQRFRVSDVRIDYQTASMSVLDLHCSELSCGIYVPPGREASRRAEVISLGFGAGPYTRYREIRFQRSRFSKRGEDVVTRIQLADLAPPVAHLYGDKTLRLADTDISQGIVKPCADDRPAS